MKKLIQVLERSDLPQKIFLFIFCILSLCSLQEGSRSGVSRSGGNWQLLGYLNGLLACSGLVLLLLNLFGKDGKIREFFKKLIKPFHLSRGMTWVICTGMAAIIVFCIFIRFDSYFSGTFLRMFVIYLSACLTAGMLKGAYPQKSFNILFLFCLLALGCAYQCGNHLGEISSNPFTLEWSEGSRYYYASLLFAKKLYGRQLPLSFLHPSRYVILSLPFLLSKAGIFIHRFWQVFLWIATTLICMIGIVKRLKIKDFWWNSILIFSGFLFLQQGPVYYHLLIAAILVLFGFHREKFWQSLLIVALASAWAGISRINWYPLPGVLAALLYFLETPNFEEKNLWKYIRQPLLWIGIGVICSFLANLAYIPLSGNSNMANFTTSFTSDLLWNRLLPGPTFPKGILTGILWLNAPLLLLLTFRLPAIRKEFGVLPRIFLLLALSVFFVGGLFVSVKIGGGSNLHNMDAFMLILLVSIDYLCFSNFYPSGELHFKHTFSIILVLALFLQPFFWSLSAWNPRRYFSAESLQHDLAEINGTIDLINSKDPQSKILFISQRQLLTFRYVTNTPLIPEYETLELMEMAISDQRTYLEQFYADLAAHEYDMVIVTKQYLVFKGEKDAFSEENNAWVRNISIPLMKYYTPITWLRYTDTEIYVPRPANELQRIITQ